MSMHCRNSTRRLDDGPANNNSSLVGSGLSVATAAHMGAGTCEEYGLGQSSGWIASVNSPEARATCTPQLSVARQAHGRRVRGRSLRAGSARHGWGSRGSPRLAVRRSSHRVQELADKMVRNSAADTVLMPWNAVTSRMSLSSLTM